MLHICSSCGVVRVVNPTDGSGIILHERGPVWLLPYAACTAACAFRQEAEARKPRLFYRTTFLSVVELCRELMQTLNTGELMAVLLRHGTITHFCVVTSAAVCVKGIYA